MLKPEFKNDVFLLNTLNALQNHFMDQASSLTENYPDKYHQYIGKSQGVATVLKLLFDEGYGFYSITE